jgi:hypothetical protein
LKNQLKSELKNSSYVYIFSDETPFYVGKGTGLRFLDHLKTNPRLTGETDVEIIMTVNESASFWMERMLISAFGRLDKGSGTLMNRTSGGNGAVGRIVAASTRAHISIKYKGGGNPMYGVNRSGELNPRFGQKQSDETKIAISNALKGRRFSAEHRHRLSEAAKRRS